MRFRLPLILVAAALLLAFWQLAQAAHAQKKEPPTAAVIELSGTIRPAKEQFVLRKLERAKARGVDYVIIEIDSPGGVLDTSFTLGDHLRTIDWAKVVAYIPKDAISAAAIVALGCEEIAIAPDAKFGDAGAFDIRTFQYIPEKRRSIQAQNIRLLARAHQRPEALAEAMVDKDMKVFLYRNKASGEEKYVTQREMDNLDVAEWERVLKVPEAGDGRFLTLSGERAVELGLAEQLAKNRDELLAKLNVVEPPAVYESGTTELFVEILNHWLISIILIVAGLVALYIELSAPGIGVGGAIAALCFGLFFWARFLGGTSGWLELILFVAGVGFLLLEFFVIPGFGFAGVIGLCLVVGSLILASQEFVIPKTPSDRDQLAVSLTVVVASGFLFLGCAVVVTRHFGRLPVLNRLVLPVPTQSETAVATKAAKLDLWPQAVNVGDIGVADSALRPAGKAQFGDQYVDVVADSAFVDPGKMVKVVQVSGNRVIVREVEGKPPVRQDS